MQYLKVLGILTAFIFASVCSYAGDDNSQAQSAFEVYSTQPSSIIIPLNLPKNSVPLELKLIPSGTFTMGYSGVDAENPPHQVTITNSFYIGKYEVTQAQWLAVMGNTPSQDFGVGNNNPVYYVTWNDCQSFISKLNQMGQGSLRLPTEAEWEYACRAGNTTKCYWGDGSDGSQADKYAWYGGNANGQTHSVGMKLPNAWGLFDMNGNIWELC